MSSDPNVQIVEGTRKVTIPNHKIKNAAYLDCKNPVELSEDKHTIIVLPFDYGEARCIRVVRFK